MKKLLLTLTLAVMTAMLGFANVATFNYASGSDRGPDMTVDGVRILIEKGGGSSAPSTSNGSWNHIRVYYKNTITITAPTGGTLQEVVFTTNGSFLANSAADKGTFNANDKTWTAGDGNTSSVVITNGPNATSGNVQITKIEVTYTEGSGGGTDPGTSSEPTSVIAFVAEGATYSGDGTQVSLSGNLPGVDFTAAGVCNFTLTKAASQTSTSNVQSGAARWYKGDNITITPMSGITITGLKMQTASGYTSGNITAVTPSDGWNGYEWSGASKSAISFTNTAQIRFTYLEVTYSRDANSKADAGISFSQKEVTAKGLNATGFAPSLTKETDATPTYESSNTAVATVNASSGEVTLVAYGTTKITAKVAETSTYAEGQATYTLNVVPETSPFSVADALTLLTNGFTGNAAVKGYIVKIDDIDTGEYGNATYYIADTADGEKLEVYRGYSLDGKKFNEAGVTMIEVGALVTVEGSLVVYNGTKEFTSGSKITSYTAPVKVDDVFVPAKELKSNEYTPYMYKFYEGKSYINSIYRTDLTNQNGPSFGNGSYITNNMGKDGEDKEFTPEGLKRGNLVLSGPFANQREKAGAAFSIYDFGGEIGEVMVFNGANSKFGEALQSTFGLSAAPEIPSFNLGTSNLQMFWLYDKITMNDVENGGIPEEGKTVRVRVELNCYNANMGTEATAFMSMSRVDEQANEAAINTPVAYNEFVKREGDKADSGSYDDTKTTEWNPYRWMVYEFDMPYNRIHGFVKFVHAAADATTKGYNDGAMLIRSLEFHYLTEADEEIPSGTARKTWKTYASAAPAAAVKAASEPSEEPETPELAEATMTWQTDMMSGMTPDAPMLTEPEETTVKVSYADGDLKFETFGECNEPITFKVNVNEGTATATDQVAYVDDMYGDAGAMIYYYADVATKTTVVKATIYNIGDDSAEMTVEPWGEYLEEYDFFNGAFYNTVVTLPFSIEGLPDKPAEGGDFGNEAIEGTWEFTLDWHYIGEYSNGKVTDTYTATLDGNVVTFTDKWDEYPIVAEFTAENTLTFKKAAVGPVATNTLYQNPFVDNNGVENIDDSTDLNFGNVTATFDPEAGTLTFTEGTGIAYGYYSSTSETFSYYLDAFDFISAKKESAGDLEPTIEIGEIMPTIETEGEGEEATRVLTVWFSITAANLPQGAHVYAQVTYVDDDATEPLDDQYEVLGYQQGEGTLTFTEWEAGTYELQLVVKNNADDIQAIAISSKKTYTVAESSGIAGIEMDADAPVRYFNLQGVEVVNPAAGQMYIRVEGNQATKVLVRP